MQNQPLVSVIITTYNRVNKVGRCIDSILNQNYDNFEIIVVDDCSTDNTKSFFENNYTDKIKYTRHDYNKGVQFASNTGFNLAKGKYLAFVGDDDVWCDREKLNEQVKIFENDESKKYGIVTTDINIITKEKSYRKNIKKPKNIVKHILKENGIIYGSAALIRSDIFKQVGKFEESLPRGTDSDVFRRIILLGYDVYFINKVMIDYHFDSSDQMTSFNEKGINRAIKSHLYKIKTYNEILKFYPGVRSYIFLLIGRMYLLRFYSNKNYHAKALSKKYLIKSIISNPLNIRSWYFFLKLFFGLSN